MKNKTCYRLGRIGILIFALSCSWKLSAQIRNVTFTDVRKKDLVDIFKEIVTGDNTKAKVKQQRIIGIKQQNNKTYLSFIPVSTKRRGGNDVYVSSVSSAFYLGRSDSTYLSHVSLEPATNFKTKFGVGYRFNLWTKNNAWNIPGEALITNLDQYTWGLGAATTEDAKYKIATKYIRLRVNFNRDFHSSRMLFYGVGFTYDRFYNLVPDKDMVYTSNPERYPIDKEESLFSSGYNISFLFDTRHNSVNPSKGTFLTLTIRNNPVLLGNRYVWSSLYFDARRYFPLTNFNTGGRQLLALWFMYWGTYGNIPYLNLPATSTDMFGQSGRGYNFARFRGKEMIYAEGEYRFDLSYNGLLGGVLFGNVQSLTEPDTNRFAYLLLAGGLGARIKVNKKSNTNLGLDLSWAKDGFNFSVVLGEAF